MIYTLTLNPAIDRELTVPEIIFNEVLRAGTLRIDCGGKGFNVSRALAAWGEENVALGFIGGLVGQRIANRLAELGIRTDFVQIAGETRTNISIVSQSAAHHIKVNEAGPSITPTEQAALLQKVRTLAQAHDWWVLSGSLPPGAAVTIYADVIQIVQSAGAHVVLDTSGAALRHACAAQPFLAKPNAAEAGELVGMQVTTPKEAHTAASAIHALGVQHLLISLGKTGALLSTGEDCWLAQPPEIVQRNPIGAGDSLVAGLVWGLSHDFSWLDALRWGVASGAAAASLDGTAMGSRALVESLIPQVKVIPF